MAPPTTRVLSFGVVVAAATAAFNVTVDPSFTLNPALSANLLGCTHDPSLGQSVRAFSSNLVYGSSFESGPLAIPAWTFRSVGIGRAAVSTESLFNNKPSLALSIGYNGPPNSMAAGVNRGIGGAGFELLAGRSYAFTTYGMTLDKEQNMAFAELRDYTRNISLARQEFPITGGGGSSWVRYDFNLVPTHNTTCVVIPVGSDRTIDCGATGSDAHACVRCGGELLVGLEGTGNSEIGFTALQPGPWGVVADAGGAPLPVLATGAAMLTGMGTRVLRVGGNSSRANAWKVGGGGGAEAL